MKHNGVTTIGQLKERCRIDDITGCWNWAWGLSGKPSFPIPMLHLGAGVVGLSKITSIPAYRAAWLLSGKSIERGHVVYRSCCNPLCCNPNHLRCGPRKEMYGHYAATGRNKGQPHRKVANAKNRAKMMTPAERVAEVEMLLNQGMIQKEVALKMGMCPQTVRKIRLGLHPHCTQNSVQKVIRGASVFAWRPAA